MLDPAPATGPTRRINGRHPPRAAPRRRPTTTTTTTTTTGPPQRRRGSRSASRPRCCRVGLVGFVGLPDLRRAAGAAAGGGAVRWSASEPEAARSQLHGGEPAAGEVQQVEPRRSTRTAGWSPPTRPAGTQVDRAQHRHAAGRHRAGPGRRAAADRARRVAEAGPQLTERGLDARRQTEQTDRATPTRSARSSRLDARRRARTCRRAPRWPSSSASSRPRVAVPERRRPGRRRRAARAGGGRLPGRASTSVDGGGDEGTVAGTDPAAGTQAKRRLARSRCRSPAATTSADVPDVRRASRRPGRGRAALAAAGFTRGQHAAAQQTTPAQVDGRVLEQSPASGQNVGHRTTRSADRRRSQSGGGNSVGPARPADPATTAPLGLRRCAYW